MNKIDVFEMRSVEAGTELGIFTDRFGFGFVSNNYGMFFKLRILSGKNGIFFCFNNGGLYYGDENDGIALSSDQINDSVDEILFITPLGILNRFIQLIF